MKTFDRFNDEVVMEAYGKDNYRVINCEKGTGRCYIFCSSNGLYFPNTKEEFIDKIINKNRFEWENLASSEVVFRRCDKQIFIRDIYKQWYVEGVNRKVNSIDKLIELLKRLTEGYEVVTVGTSSGGYIAALIASKLNATTCFDFSGQVSLWEIVDENKLLYENSLNERYNKYYNITEEIKKSSCIFYFFYAANCKIDIDLWNEINSCPNVYGFGFLQKKHAVTMLTWNMPYVICKSRQQMEKTWNLYKCKKINPLLFSLCTMPFNKAVYYPLIKMISCIRKKETK